VRRRQRNKRGYAYEPAQAARQAVTYARNHVFERSAVEDRRDILEAALNRGMGHTTIAQVRQEFERRVQTGEFIAVEHVGAGQQYTTATMLRMEREIIGHMQEGNRRGYNDPTLVPTHIRVETEDRHRELNAGQRQAVEEIFLSREKIVGLDGIAGKTTTLERLHPNDRVLLVGDTRQHESVEAGRIFAQLQDAGMKTVKLEEIVRQKDPELKQTVEQLARGQVAEAIAGLERQGRIFEFKGHGERIAAIASEYAKSPDGTLVVSPDNRSRAEINQAIHSELQAKGVVASDEHRVHILVPRQDLTGADRTWAERYNVGDVLCYSRSSQETGIGKGEYARVKCIDGPNNRLTVELKDGTERTYDPRRQQGVSVYRDEERAFSVGDRVQLTAPARELKTANRELGTVHGIDQEGRLSLKMDAGRDLQFDPRLHPHLDHGYAATSHSSQGQTADRVLIHVDTELGAKDLLNNRMAYVAVSRGAYDAQFFTNDRETLGAALGHDVSHQSAHAPEVKQEPREDQTIASQREIGPQ
jgi:hypothetical protein